MPAAVMLTTLPDRRTASAMATALVRRKLAACVTVLDGARSTYRWKGKVERARESLLVVKTTDARYAALERFLRAGHPYDVPEVLRLPVTKGSAPYLRWLEGSVR